MAKKSEIFNFRRMRWCKLIRLAKQMAVEKLDWVCVKDFKISFEKVDHEKDLKGMEKRLERLDKNSEEYKQTVQDMQEIELLIKIRGMEK